MAKKLTDNQIQKILDRDLGNVRLAENQPARTTGVAVDADSGPRPAARMNLQKVKAKGRAAQSDSGGSRNISGGTSSAGDDDTTIVTVIPKNASVDSPGVGAKSVLISKSKGKVIAQQG